MFIELQYKMIYWFAKIFLFFTYYFTQIVVLVILVLQILGLSVLFLLQKLFFFSPKIQKKIYLFGKKIYSFLV